MSGSPANSSSNYPQNQMENSNNKSDTDSKYPLSSHPGNQPDEYVSCPYFSEHTLRKSRLPYHLIKCQKNPNAPKLLACPYNFLHRVAPDKTHEHLLLCEDKVSAKYIDRRIPSYAETRKKVFNIQSSKPRYPPLTEQ